MNSLSDNIQKIATPFDERRAQRTLLALVECVRETNDEALAERASLILSKLRARRFLKGLFGNSPFLSRLALKNTGFFFDALESDLDHTFAALLKQLEDNAALASEEEWASLLRRSKQKAALLLAAADVGGVGDTERIVQCLTAFADACIRETVHWLFANNLDLSDSCQKTVAQSGFFVLGMGKFGGHELNYSSDIDLIVFFDKEKLSVLTDDEPQVFAINLTRKLVSLLNDMTADGYVFRVDLRLRPDAGATQVALSTEAAEIYYETFGQNWERAAFIKARVIGGDMKAGEAFLEGLTPFIWRRYLDYASIEDVHSIKRQIHAHGGHREIAVNGHDVKLGWGGIREIEFFVQTQQLILGGRDPSLRGKSTCATLIQLCDRGMITQDVVDELTEAYWFLRLVEHRLQMIEDQQTHSLPVEDEGVAHVAAFCGFENEASFREELLRTLTTVREHYNSLFENEPTLSKETGSLVFTGVDDDPETLKSLENLGFERPKQISAAIRAWHHGRLRATRSERARQKLTAIVPVLLESFSKVSEPDAAFGRFNRFLEGLPAGVQLFSLLHSNPHLLGLLTSVLGSAPRLAPILAGNAQMLDAVIEPGYLDRLPDLPELQDEFAERIRTADSYEMILDEARRWSHEQSLRVGVQTLTGKAKAEQAGAAYASLAETVLTALLPVTRDYVGRRYGTLPGGDMAVLAMGKLGSREMTAASDLDLIFVYDAPDADALSDGEAPLSVTQYFMRLSQRFINALTVQTSEGGLFEVDMRLRPSGNSGPLATSIDRFEAYQREDAWTWEHMAMTRARVIGGSDVLRAKIDQVVANVLCLERDPMVVARDVLDMRQKIEDEYASNDPLEIKNVRGGLLDVEFICQFLQLTRANDHPEILRVNTKEALSQIAEAQLLKDEDAAALLKSCSHYHKITQITRVAFESSFTFDDVSAGLEQILCAAVDCKSLVELENHLKSLQARIHGLFVDVIEKPAHA